MTRRTDLAVLGALWLEGGSAFAVDLMRRKISSGRLYPSLMRLEKAGLVRRGWSSVSGRAVYSLTEPG